MNRALNLFASVLLAFAVSLSAQPAAAPAAAHTASAEARAARAYDTALRQGPETLRTFLAAFPKGADLHVHLSGAVYAETFIREAGQDGLCVDADALAFAKPPCTGKLVSAEQLSGNITPANQALYDKLVDAFSMRSFVPSAGWSGHDQFFATFGRFGGLNASHHAEWVDEVASRAAAQNQQYLELMQTPSAPRTRQIGAMMPFPVGAEPVFATMRQGFLDQGLRDDVAPARQYVKDLEARRRELEHCDTPQAAPACKVEVRFIFQILRGASFPQVFAQTLLGFETVAASMDAHEPGFVGINMVQPEDGLISMRDYTLQMRMIGYLHSIYPQVHITLHAGELAEGLVPPEGLGFHIRQAVELAHAERIGHGVDVAHEANAQALLKEMAKKHVMVEINLSSNEGILGVKGASHPFPLYRAAHVPVALSTDDEGVSRIDLTHEYVRAALDYHLSYAELKQLARTGIEHSFLAGADLWAAPGNFAVAVPACKTVKLGAVKPEAACEKFLAGSDKATAEWELERRFAAFEAAQ
ncbi:MAG: adenosine deaminase [Terracidiphilus sp.]|nr:adenosine deaminase [Terracidiphilus sp.]